MENNPVSTATNFIQYLLFVMYNISFVGGLFRGLSDMHDYQLLMDDKNWKTCFENYKNQNHAHDTNITKRL